RKRARREMPEDEELSALAWSDTRMWAELDQIAYEMSGVDPNWEVRHWPTASRGWWLARAGADAREPEAPTWLRGLVGEWAGCLVVVGGPGGVVPDRLLDSLAGLLRRLPPRRAGSTRIVFGAGLTDAQQQRVRAMAAGSPGLQVSFAPDVRLEPGGLVAPH